MCVNVLSSNHGHETLINLWQVLTKDEGGRYTPFMHHYRPQCFIRTADITASLTWPEGTPDADEKMVGLVPLLFCYHFLT